MEIRLIDLPEVAVIGKEGFCTRENNRAQALWQEANSHFAEVAALGLKDEGGAYRGFWGAMSDEAMTFAPWTEDFSRGYYLAGLQVSPDARAPEGWRKWVLPARKYLVVPVTPQVYGAVFAQVLQKELPERGLSLAGAVCDFTCPATGENFLFFPAAEGRA